MPRVTLTFDNGPCPRTTPAVLEALHARGLQAWFCVVGTQVQASGRHAEIVRETLAAGHRLANHSLTHQTPLGDAPTEPHAIREIADMHALMNDTFGDWGERWFRPFGKGGRLGPHVFSPPALQQFQALAYSVLLWNCVPRDWEDVNGWVDTALAAVTTQSHSVVVLHDLPTGAMQRLPLFLDELLQNDLEVTLSLPDDCVPIRSGQAVWPAGSMEALTQTIA